MKYGVKSVTMDEMSRQLGISKKTLYQFVKDKNDLVEQCMLLRNEDEKQKIEVIVSKTDDAIKQMLHISQLITSELQQIHPSIFFDLSKYHPSVMKMMDNHKDEFICGCIEQNLVNGINQGVYRKNLNPKVISAIYAGMIDLMLSGELMSESKLNAEEVYSEMFRYHIRGCANEQGLEYLIELVKIDNSLSAQL
jgi:AcrR family transcriptional regulator